MLKKITVLAIAATLAGCVTYTNDEGKKCTVQLNPLLLPGAAIITLAGEGDAVAEAFHHCREPQK